MCAGVSEHGESMRGKDEFTDTMTSVCVCASVHLRLNHLCLCVFTQMCTIHCLEEPEYISRCVQSGAGLWLLNLFFSLHPSVGSSKMAICKTRPSVSPLPRLKALPHTAAPLPPLSSPLCSSHHLFYFLPSLSSQVSRLISIPPVCPQLSPSICLFISLSFLLICPS